jgi:hypothetical protein
MSELRAIDVEQRSRLVWQYIRILKSYRCLDCCVLVEFEERSNYFASGFCEFCQPFHPKTRWPRMRAGTGNVRDLLNYT